MFRKYSLTLLLLLVAINSYGQLSINEIMQSNVDCIMDDLNEFPDSWVELYNLGTTSDNLSNYSIGLNNKIEDAWQLPDSVIAAGGGNCCLLR